jgi:hypothetical protein
MSKRLSSAAAVSEEVRRTLRYVEPLSDTRTQLADFFSILSVRLLGAVKADNKLGRTMVGFAAGAGAGDFSLPVRTFLVESAECVSTLGDSCPGLVGSRDMGHEAACWEGNVTALRGLSLRHAIATRLFCRGV